MQPSRIVLAALLILSLSTSAHAATPKVGDKAPEFKAKKWLTQAPPAIPGGEKAGEHVFLVEFWATWCGPCIKGMPHLAELHKKHQKAGLVILSLSAEGEKIVSDFVKKNEKNMPYYVAADEATTQIWMASIPGIPHAFIVDKNGIVVWSGNPLDTRTLDSVLEQVLAGKFDLAAAMKAAEMDRQFESLMQELQSAYVMHDGDKLFETLDKLIALKPKELQPYLIKRSLLTEFDKKDQIPAWDDVIEKQFSDSFEAMFQMAVNELTLDYSARRPAFMLRCARQACELSEWREHEALALLSRVLCELGMTEQALKAQAQALAVAPDDNKEYHQKVLKYYESAMKLRKETPAEFIKKPAPEKKIEDEGKDQAAKPATDPQKPEAAPAEKKAEPDQKAGGKDDFIPSHAALFGKDLLDPAQVMSDWDVGDGTDETQKRPSAHQLLDAMIGRDFLGYDLKPSATNGYDRWLDTADLGPELLFIKKQDNRFAEYIRSFRETTNDITVATDIVAPRGVRSRRTIIISAGKDGIYGTPDDVRNYGILSGER